MSESSSTPRADVVDALTSLLSRARSLHARVSPAGATHQGGSGEGSSLSVAARRLQRSVIRPLELALGRASTDDRTGRTGPTDGDGKDAHGAGQPGSDPSALLAGDPLWQLTVDATRLRLSPGLPSEVQE